MQNFSRHLLLVFLSLALFSPVSLADHVDTHVSSIKMINSNNFGIDQAEIESIKARMQEAVDEGTLAGNLILVGNGSGVGLLESVGYRAEGTQDPVNKDTIFRIYSMTKPIISVAIMTMVEDGLIGLDDPVEKYIPAFADLEVMDPETGRARNAGKSISIRNLLTHESGVIQELFSPDSALGKLYGEQLRGDMLLQDWAAKIGDLPVFFEPGTAWHYGHSTNVLGAVLEVAGGKTLDLVLEERIFGPLGMDETSFWVAPEKRSRIAEPIHGAMSDNTVARKLLSGDGGLNSTTEDYVRFAEMLLNGGTYRGHRIIEESTLQQMLVKHMGPDVSREYFFYGDRGDWGLGFHIQPTTDDPDGPFNFGWRGIGGTIFIVDRENDFYMIYMEQKRGGPRAAFNNNVAQQVIYEAMRN
ncbi:MAG: serine hydrolase [Gammaproteobacteria bacterium]